MTHTQTHTHTRTHTHTQKEIIIKKKPIYKHLHAVVDYFGFRKRERSARDKINKQYYI